MRGADKLRRLERPRGFVVLFHITVVFLVAAFAVIVYGHVFSNGLCCADDSTNAIVAKNLAFGKGYSNSISFDGSPGLKYFDPEITTGPTLNIPAAVLIYIFGNVPWAPGFVTATISLVLLLIIAIILSRQIGWYRSGAYLCVLLFFLYSVTAGLHFEQWYSLIGEIPAALFCITGAAILAHNPRQRTPILLSSALYGIAAMTKLLALLSFVPVCIWLLWQVIATKDNRLTRLVNFIGAALAFSLPFVIFELWKLSVLGAHLYLANIKELVTFYASGAFAGAPGNTAGGAGGPLQRCVAYSSSMYQHFGFLPIGLLLVVAAVATLLYYYAPKRNLDLFFLWLLLGALVHGSWWLFFSRGWPRYILIGLCLYFAAIACVVFIGQSWQVVGSITVLLLVVFACSYQRLVDPVNFVMTYKYSYTPRVANLRKTAALLQGLKQDRPFVMGWWATAGDVEYAMPSVGNFIQSDHVFRDRENADLLLVRNKVWVNWGTTPQFTAWEQKCNEVLLDAPPYLVSRCPVDPPVRK